MTPTERQGQGSGSAMPGQPGTGNQDQRRRQGTGRGQQREQQAPKAPKFEGRCEELSGHVYDYANARKAADQFTKTTREICEYVGRTYKYGADTRTALESLAVPVFVEPLDPPADATRTQVRMWEKEVDEHVKRQIILSENLKSAYSLIYGQCSDAMRVKLESRPNHETIESTADSIGLLENIRTVMYQFQSERYAPLALHDAKRRFYTFAQDKHTTCQQYHETKNNAEVIEYCGGALGNDPGLIEAELTRVGVNRVAATDAQVVAAVAAAKERVLAYAFLAGSDRF